MLFQHAPLPPGTTYVQLTVVRACPGRKGQILPSRMVNLKWRCQVFLWGIQVFHFLGQGVGSYRARFCERIQHSEKWARIVLQFNSGDTSGFSLTLQ